MNMCNICHHYIFSLIMFSLTISTTLCSCEKEEPRQNSEAIVPEGPRDPEPSEGSESDKNGDDSEGNNSGENSGTNNSGDNQEGENSGTGENTGEEDSEGESAIIGSWATKDESEQFHFEKDLKFHATTKQDGEMKGTYVYDSLKSHLWLSVNREDIVYSKEYRCIIEKDRMKLYDINGKLIELTKTK